MAPSFAMTPKQYVDHIRDLVSRHAYGEALDYSERHGPEMDHLLSLQQFGALGAMLKHADMVMKED